MCIATVQRLVTVRLTKCRVTDRFSHDVLNEHHGNIRRLTSVPCEGQGFPSTLYIYACNNTLIAELRSPPM